ncbi:MAG: hypothetical protein QOE34_875 [Verrucomicrobiota bacterium]
MVNALSKSTKICLLLSAAIIVPFALVTLYVSIMRGDAVPNHLVHRGLEVLIASFCLPFIYLLPFGMLARAAMAVVFVPMLFVVTDGYGFWLACAGFENCI